MTGKEILKQVEQFGELEISDEALVSWIDQAQKEASLELPVVKSITANNVVIGTVVTLPQGLFKIISATYENGEYPLTSLKAYDASLVFLLAASSVTVIYSSISSTYTSSDNELTIHPALHSAVGLYIISMYYDKEGEGDGEESGLAERYYQRWLYAKALAIGNILNSDNDISMRDPVQTIDTLPKSSRRGLVEDEFYE